MNIEKLVEGTMLTIGHFDSLARMASRKTLGRSSDKMKAAARFAKELASALKKEDASEELIEILKSPGIEVATGALHGMLDEAGAKSGPEPKTEAAPKEGKPKPAKEKKSPKQTSSANGKRATFNGRKLFPLVKENPRRKGSHGHTSMEIILKTPGIAYEAFIKAGGRRNDLTWDINAGNAEARLAKE